MVEDPSDIQECRARALRLLALRTHFSAELEAKLEARGFEPAAVDEVVAQLTAEKMLDDIQAGVEFVETRLRRRPVGPMRLLADLGRRGLSSEKARSVVDAAYPQDEGEVARRAADRSSVASVEALARRLDRLGFSSAVIGSVLDEYREADRKKAD